MQKQILWPNKRLLSGILQNEVLIQVSKLVLFILVNLTQLSGFYQTVDKLRITQFVYPSVNLEFNCIILSSPVKTVSSLLDDRSILTNSNSNLVEITHNHW